MRFFHEGEEYPLSYVTLHQEEGHPCILRVKIPQDLAFKGEGTLFYQQKPLAKGQCVHSLSKKDGTEVLYRCGEAPSQISEQALYHWDRVSHEVKKVSLHHSSQIHALRVLDEPITREIYPKAQGVHLCVRAKWMYENEVIVNALPFFPQNLPFPLKGQRIKGGYEVIESHAGNEGKKPSLKLYGLSCYEHVEILHVKIQHGKEGGWLKVPLEMPVVSQDCSFLRANPRILEEIFQTGMLYLDAMRRHSVIEASFVFEEAFHVTLEDSLICTLPGLGEVTGKIIGYKASCDEKTKTIRLRFALSDPLIRLPSFTLPQFPEVPKERPWIEEGGENFLKLRALKGVHQEEIHWSIS